MQYYPFHVILGGKTYGHGVDLVLDQIYQVFEEKHILPKTAAINAAEYAEYFRQWTDQGYEVIHITLGSGLSATYQNCCLAAEGMPGVYPIDSRNLSTGSGLVVLEAADRIAKGMPAAQIAREVQELTNRCHASFVIDTLEFLYKGGRCSALAMLGANLLQLKPCIEVDNADGTMSVGKNTAAPWIKRWSNMSATIWRTAPIWTTAGFSSPIPVSPTNVSSWCAGRSKAGSL